MYHTTIGVTVLLVVDGPGSFVKGSNVRTVFGQCHKRVAQETTHDSQQMASSHHCGRYLPMKMGPLQAERCGRSAGRSHRCSGMAESIAPMTHVSSAMRDQMLPVAFSLIPIACSGSKGGTRVCRAQSPEHPFRIRCRRSEESPYIVSELLDGDYLRDRPQERSTTGAQSDRLRNPARARPCGLPTKKGSSIAIEA